MAYINVAEWSPDQVTDWLKGLDNAMYIYVQSFTNNQVGGLQLLNIRPYELEQLGMHSIGHQEIVLDAVEHLRNFHYHLDKENLQFLALHVATAASCLFRQLKYHCDQEELKTQILNDITRTLVYIKPLVAWLDRAPFRDNSQFIEIRDNILKLGLEMATVAQRDRFVENPVKQIRNTSKKLAELANYIIQDITDPMVLQPASLEIVTLKKRESDLGFYIMPSYHGALRITDIKLNSPAHNSGKIEEGDEIVQINYQTVVGWQYKTVIMQLQESPTDVLLTLKKRPKHTKIYGQIYMKPYRLPSKKRTLPYNLSDSLPSPRPELLSVPEYPIPISRAPEKEISSDNDSINSDILTPNATKETSKEFRMYLPKPRAVLQRRNTICGDQFSSFKNLGNIVFWSEKRNEPKDQDSPSLRDKSISFGFGLEISPRPTTYIGMSNSNINGKVNDFSCKNGSLPEMTSEKLKNNESCKVEKTKTGVSKVVRFDSNMKFETCHIDTKYTCNVDNTVLETFEPIPYADEEVNNQVQEKNDKKNILKNDKDNKKLLSSNINNNLPDLIPNQSKAIRMSKDTGLVEAVNTVVITREIIKRGKLDKSHSTPAYAQEIGENDEVPPAIEPRQGYLNKIPPAPPPRPKRFSDTQPAPMFVSATTSKQSETNDENNKTKVANVVDLKNPENCQNIIEAVSQQISVQERVANFNRSESTMSNRYTPPLKKLPPTKHFLEEKFEALELLTPNKTKSLTLKKKNTLLAKRRKVSLKALGTSDIQGHLYRRSKDKHGVTYWAKLYFVLIESTLYGFKTKDSPKASCLIFLTGFTVSLATEVHSKSHAFKVYHPSKTFYFAAETQEALSQWMEYIQQATLKGDTNAFHAATDKNIKELYTETESSDDEFSFSDKSKLTNSLISSVGYKSNSSSKHEGSDGNTPSSTKTEKSSYHLNFGSLKKFTKFTNSSFSPLYKISNSNDKKILSSDVPVPTAQFRSYRKVPGNAGLQLGTNSMIIQSIDISQNIQLHNIEPNPNKPNNNAITTTTSSSMTTQQSLTERKVSISSLSNENDHIFYDPQIEIEKGYDKEKLTSIENHKIDEFSSSNTNLLRILHKRTPKKLTYNYIHASNPNLVEFDFQTSKTLDHSFPKINSSNNWDHHNLQGMITLKDLMLQKQVEEAQEVYNNRVYLGVEKKDDHHLRKKINKDDQRDDYKSEKLDKQSNELKPIVNKIQSRSLPKTPDYAQSFKPDDKDIIMARSKEGQKLRDFGYEFISGDDQNSDLNNIVSSSSGNSSDIWLKRNDKISPATSNSFKKKGINWMNPSDMKKHVEVNDDKNTSRQGSLKKAKNRLDNLKASSEKLFQFKQINEKETLKTSSKNSDKVTFFKQTSFVPMTLPLNKKPSVPLSISGNLQSDWVIVNRNDVECMRKNSIPERTSNSYLSKLNFTTTKSAKERKLLGSPRLHRALFGRSASHSDSHTIDHEIFTPVNSMTKNSNEITSDVVTGLKIPNITLPATTPASPSTGEPEYPFESETYSLSDPNINLTLNRRRNLNQNK